jgi:predicted short-subunit dehydrogenase-like oxidoreductase (DUF2520 family)
VATFILVGPGRAGLSLGTALQRAGHQAAGVLARSSGAASDAAGELECRALEWADELPPADLLILAVSDDSIEEVAGRLAPAAGAVRFAVHLSGLKPVAALRPLSVAGPRIGAFHPLQTLPNPVDGAAVLPGAWVAVTADDAELREFLEDLALSISARPFPLPDSYRDLYHAAAAASSNYVITTLALAEALFGLVGVPFEAARPLVAAVTDNAFRLGPLAALTGPIARGDIGTVRGQLAAVARWAPELEDDYRALAKATARVAGTAQSFEDIL